MNKQTSKANRQVVHIMNRRELQKAFNANRKVKETSEKSTHKKSNSLKNFIYFIVNGAPLLAWLGLLGFVAYISLFEDLRIEKKNNLFDTIRTTLQEMLESNMITAQLKLKLDQLLEYAIYAQFISLACFINRFLSPNILYSNISRQSYISISPTVISLYRLAILYYTKEHLSKLTYNLIAAVLVLSFSIDWAMWFLFNIIQRATRSRNSFLDYMYYLTEVLFSGLSTILSMSIALDVLFKSECISDHKEMGCIVGLVIGCLVCHNNFAKRETNL